MTALICGFCSTGCGLTAHARPGALPRIEPSADYPVNRGVACPKGWEALTPLAAHDRATAPLLHGRRVSWEGALAAMVDEFRAIQRKHGPEALGFLSTGQIFTEEMALLGALGKIGLGMLHCDSNTRQCMATSATAYKESFGFDVPPYTYADFEESDVIVLWGSNLCIAHPILWGRIMKSRRRPRVIVVDPRRTETAVAASVHLAARPKSDLTLLYGLAHILIARGWIDQDFIREHTSGFDGLVAHVTPYTPERVAAATGLSMLEIEALASAIGRSRRASLWWTMGVNQSHEGTRVAQGIINLALLTGNIGRPGTGANSITGQCNAMGSRLFSSTSNLIGGHDFANPAHRDKVAGVLGVPVERIPTRAGLAYDQILEAVLARKIRGLWIVATNPAHSWVSQDDTRRILARLDFLVVQELYTTTDTARLAHLVLPAAGWGEKSGTFINSERRIGLSRAAATPPGEALPDFEIFTRVAHAFGLGDLLARFASPEATFALMQELSRGQPCDISGIDGWAGLEHGGVQWPHPAGAPAPALERRLFEDGRFYHPDGRARLCYEAPRPLPEPTSRDYPFTLLTGRGSASQWHTQTRTGKSAVLARLHPRELYLELSPVDARELGIAADDTVVVTSRRAEVRARAFLTHSVRPGQVFMPMHYEAVNRLTLAAFDPYSRQPAYKACAVSVRRATDS